MEAIQLTPYRDICQYLNGKLGSVNFGGILCDVLAAAMHFFPSVGSSAQVMYDLH